MGATAAVTGPAAITINTKTTKIAKSNWFGFRRVAAICEPHCLYFVIIVVFVFIVIRGRRP